MRQRWLEIGLYLLAFTAGGLAMVERGFGRNQADLAWVLLIGLAAAALLGGLLLARVRERDN